MQELDNVILVENCLLTSSVLARCLKENISVSVLSYTGEYLGSLENKLGKNVFLRLKQYELQKDDSFCIALGRRFVAGKLANMRTIIMRYSRSSKTSSDIDRSISKLKEYAVSAGTAETEQYLLGIEGAGSREYLSALKSIITEPFHFDGRNRRPPKDSVNAMLGFAYAMLEHFVQRAVYISGLDPYCGFYHKLEYGRESLVLDLMEALRPVIADSVVLNCCRRKMIDPKTDFESRDGGIFLNEKGREKFYTAFYNRMNVKHKDKPEEKSVSYDRICDEQAALMAAALRNSDPEIYKPFLIK